MRQRVIVVGSSISASDLVLELYSIVDGPLYLSQRTPKPLLASFWALPNIKVKPTIKKLSLENNGTVEFSDGTTLSDIDKIVFATGYRLSYPYLQPNPVTESNRLAGFYQHIFKIGDPSLAVVGQVCKVPYRKSLYKLLILGFLGAGSLELQSLRVSSSGHSSGLSWKRITTSEYQGAGGVGEREAAIQRFYICLPCACSGF